MCLKILPSLSPPIDPTLKDKSTKLCYILAYKIFEDLKALFYILALPYTWWFCIPLQNGLCRIWETAKMEAARNEKERGIILA